MAFNNSSVMYHGAFALESDSLTVVIRGYCFPVITLLTVCCNTLVCLALSQPHMRSPTNTLLFTLAVSDTLTATSVLPVNFYFYSLQFYQEWLPYRWCAVYPILADFLPTMFHTSSIWLTMTLAIQRYLCVKWPLKVKFWFTKSKTFGIIALIFLLSFLVHIRFLFDTERSVVKVPSLINPDLLVEACHESFVPFVQRYANVYFNMYYWTRVIFIHLIPCISLVVMTILLLKSMKKASKKHNRLINSGKSFRGSKTFKEKKSGFLLIAVLIVFLITEVPTSITFVLLILSNTFNITLMSRATWIVLTIFLNLFVVCGYPSNILIYVALSSRFRKAIKTIFFGHKVKGDAKKTGLLHS